MISKAHGEWKWASHTPLIKGILDLYKPQLILELGCGMYSTPLFQSNDIVYKGIENDLKWIKSIKNELGVDIDYHDLKGIDRTELWGGLSRLQKKEIKEYYQNLSTSDFVLMDRNPKLLFVDSFACTRKIAISVLKPQFDIIIYHDSQPNKKSGIINHLYNQEEEAGFVKYHLKTVRNWTSVMLKTDKGIEMLKNNVAPYIVDFYKQWGQNVGMEIIQL